MLYSQTTYLLAAMTPAMRDVIRLMRGVRVGCFGTLDLIRTASDWRTVAMACRPAARIVSPDSGCGSEWVREQRRCHPHTNEINYKEDVSARQGGQTDKRRTYSICQAQSAGRLDAPADILDFCAITIRLLQPIVDRAEIAPGEHLEASHDALAREVLDGLNGAGLGDLHLERALAEAQAERLGDVVLHFGFENNVVACDAEVYVALAYEGWDVGCGEEDPVHACD